MYILNATSGGTQVTEGGWDRISMEGQKGLNISPDATSAQWSPVCPTWDVGGHTSRFLILAMLLGACHMYCNNV